MHCHKNNLKLRIETELIYHGWMQRSMSGFCEHIHTVYLAPKPDIYDMPMHNCICSNRGRLGFYAEIQIIFGTVNGFES